MRIDFSFVCIWTTYWESWKTTVFLDKGIALSTGVIYLDNISILFFVAGITMKVHRHTNAHTHEYKQTRKILFERRYLIPCAHVNLFYTRKNPSELSLSLSSLFSSFHIFVFWHICHMRTISYVHFHLIFIFNFIFVFWS